MDGYIYLLRTRASINANEQVYKIGKTCQENFRRFSGYTKGCCLELFIRINNYSKVETQLISLFTKVFKKRIDYGNEYFEGDKYEMIAYVYTFLLDNKIVRDDNKSDNKIKNEDNIKQLQSCYHNLVNDLQRKKHYFQISEFENIMKGFNVDHIIASRNMKVDKKVCVDIKKMITGVRSFKTPSKKNQITCKQYHAYCSLCNAFSDSHCMIDRYEKARKNTNNPGLYVEIKSSPSMKITREMYKKNINKCCDAPKLSDASNIVNSMSNIWNRMGNGFSYPF
jgi:hypothetical protein